MKSLYDIENFAHLVNGKFDSLGRKRHPNQDNNKGGPGKAKGNGEGLTEFVQIRMTPEMKAALQAKGKVAEQIRTYIEWGLENDG